jgi:glutamate---cysteine ligase / carboxylate-amine ligase
VAVRAVGIEEELLVVDPATGSPVQAGPRLVRKVRAETAARVVPNVPVVLDGSGMSDEFMRQQVEVGTAPRTDLSALADQVREHRRIASRAAEGEGLAVAATGTSPVPVTPAVSDDARYLSLLATFRQVAGDQLINGCHLHVDTTSRDEAVAVVDRLQPWLPLLRAISSNSPFWKGRDSGYASYRSLVWGRWPSAGPTEPFGSVEVYEQTVEALIATGAVVDRGNLYFDARPSERYPTVEIRAADVCLHPDDAVLLGALARGLVSTLARHWRDEVPFEPVRVALLRTAHWRAARDGLGGHLQHPVTHQPVPASEALRALVEAISPALVQTGDYVVVQDLVEQVLRRGTGAAMQRQAFHRRARLADVVRMAIRQTCAI